MKKFSKFICVLMVALMLVMPFDFVGAKSKTTTTTTTTTSTTSEKSNVVNVYVFYSDGCPHCAALHTSLNSFKEDKSVSKMFNVVDYEISSSVNQELMQKVAAYFNHIVEGVPFYVIGNQYFEGYSETGESNLLKTIKDAYKDKNYIDVVDGIGTGKITGTIDELSGEKEGNNIVGIIILAITVAIIIVLIICSSKNKYYDDEEEIVEEVKEEKKEEPKKTSTASSSKKASNKATATKKTTSKNTKTTKKKKV